MYAIKMHYFLEELYQMAHSKRVPWIGQLFFKDKATKEIKGNFMKIKFKIQTLYMYISVLLNLTCTGLRPILKPVFLVCKYFCQQKQISPRTISL